MRIHSSAAVIINDRHLPSANELICSEQITSGAKVLEDVLVARFHEGVLVPGNDLPHRLRDVPEEVHLLPVPEDVLQLLLLQGSLNLTPRSLDGIVHQAAHGRGVQLLRHVVQETQLVVVGSVVVQHQQWEPTVLGWNDGGD